MSSLQGENSVLSYLRLSCRQLRFRFCLPIITSFVFVREEGGAEDAHAQNCNWFRTSHVCLFSLFTHAADPNLTCISPRLLPSCLLFEDMAMMWMKVRSRSRPGMYYYFNRATQESTWKEPPRHLISEVCRALGL